MITETEARTIARRHVGEDSDQFRFVCVSTRLSGDEWLMLFAVFSAKGNELNCPIGVRVHRVTGQVTIVPGM